MTPADLVATLTAAGEPVPAADVLARVAAWMTKHGVTRDYPVFELSNQLDPFVHRLLGRDDRDAHNCLLSLDRAFRGPVAYPRAPRVAA